MLKRLPQKKLRTLDQREMVLTSEWLEMGISDSTLKKQLTLMNAERRLSGFASSRRRGVSED